jgi:hypothetical protein
LAFARINWAISQTGEEVASGLITANMEGTESWLRIQVENLD